MADETTVVGDHPDMDYAEHDNTYSLFTTLFKWGTVFCVCCIILLALLTL